MFGLDLGDFLVWPFQQSPFPGKHTMYYHFLSRLYLLYSIFSHETSVEKVAMASRIISRALFYLVRLSLCRSCPGGADAPTSSPDCTWSLLTTTLFKSHNIDFKLGEEVRNITPNIQQNN